MMRIIFFGLLLIAAPLTDAHTTECYEGKATIDPTAPSDKCTDKERGFYNASAGPLTHDGCTAAKAHARQKLDYRVQASCKPYVQTNKPCTVITLKHC